LFLLKSNIDEFYSGTKFIFGCNKSEWMRSECIFVKSGLMRWGEVRCVMKRLVEEVERWDELLNEWLFVVSIMFFTYRVTVTHKRWDCWDEMKLQIDDSKVKLNLLPWTQYFNNLNIVKATKERRLRLETIINIRKQTV